MPLFRFPPSLPMSGPLTCNLPFSPQKNKKQVHFVLSICLPQCGHIPSSQSPKGG